MLTYPLRHLLLRAQMLPGQGLHLIPGMEYRALSSMLPGRYDGLLRVGTIRARS